MTKRQKKEKEPELEESRVYRNHHEQNDDELEEALPILTPGRQAWKPQVKRLKRQDHGAQQEQEEHEEASEGASDDPKPAEEVKSAEEVKREIAECVMAIQESPESEFKKRYGLIRGHLAGAHAEVAAPAAALLLIDLLPGYAIRPLTEAEQKASVSKEVKAVRDYEQALLQAYRHYLTHLDRWLSDSQRPRMQRVGLAVAERLISSASHFNLFEQGVLKPLIKLFLMSGKGENEKQRGDGLGEAGRLLAMALNEDLHGQVTCWVVRSLAEAIATAGYHRTTPAVLLLLLQGVRIREVNKAVPTNSNGGNLKVAPAAQLKPPKKISLMSKREKKEWRVRLQAAQKLAEAEGSYSVGERRRWAEDTTRHLFRILFGTLKLSAIRATLLSPLLECLTKHARHLNEAYLADLLHLLRGIAQRKDLNLAIAAHLCLALAALQTIQEQAATLSTTATASSTIDLGFVYRLLFAMLPKATSEHDLELLGRVWQSLLGVKRRTSISPLRLAAFAQRLADLAVSRPAQRAHWLGILLEHMQAHTSILATLLDGETVGHGYNPTVDDPDLTSPYARSLMPILVQLETVAKREKNNAIMDLLRKIKAMQPK